MCDHASGSTRLGSKGRVRVIVELRLSLDFEQGIERDNLGAQDMCQIEKGYW